MFQLFPQSSKRNYVLLMNEFSYPVHIEMPTFRVKRPQKPRRVQECRPPSRLNGMAICCNSEGKIKSRSERSPAKSTLGFEQSRVMKNVARQSLLPLAVMRNYAYGQNGRVSK